MKFATLVALVAGASAFNFVPRATNFKKHKGPQVYIPQTYHLDHEVLEKTNYADYKDSLQFFVNLPWNTAIDPLDNPYFTFKQTVYSRDGYDFNQGIFPFRECSWRDDYYGLFDAPKSSYEGKDDAFWTMKGKLLCMNDLSDMRMFGHNDGPKEAATSIMLEKCNPEKYAGNCASEAEIEEVFTKTMFDIIGVQTSVVDGKLDRQPFYIHRGLVPTEGAQGKLMPIMHLHMGVDSIQRGEKSEEFVNIHKMEQLNQYVDANYSVSAVLKVAIHMGNYGTMYQSPMQYYEENSWFSMSTAAKLSGAVLSLLTLAGSELI